MTSLSVSAVPVTISSPERSPYRMKRRLLRLLETLTIVAVVTVMVGFGSYLWLETSMWAGAREAQARMADAPKPEVRQVKGPSTPPESLVALPVAATTITVDWTSILGAVTILTVLFGIANWYLVTKIDTCVRGALDEFREEWQGLLSQYVPRAEWSSMTERIDRDIRELRHK